MAKVWFSVVVFISLQHVFARDCSDTVIARIRSCDECIRCGYQWCERPGPNEPRCFKGGDGICPDSRAELKSFNQEIDINQSDSGLHFMTPKYIMRSVLVGAGEDHKTFTFFTKQKDPEIYATVVNSSVPHKLQTEFEIKPTRECDNNGACKVYVKAFPTVDFCPSDGTTHENITFKIAVKDGPVALAMYHVPCACSCIEPKINAAEECNRHGDLSCGVCNCYSGWEGEYCEKKIKSEKCDRGDIPNACYPTDSTEVCANNGECYCNEVSAKCHCNNVEGSQYFDETCSDICTVTNYHDSCLMTDQVGQCKDEPRIFIENKNDTLLNIRDHRNWKVWINCNVTNDGCMIQYAAMKDKENKIHVMILDACGSTAGAVVTAGQYNITVPVVLGVIAIVAAAAAVAGYMMWKNRTPPLPSNDPQYTNIEAQDSTGVNPLYIPPTSSFKNPTYGKW